MKYIFIIQGEGRGHMTQAISMATILRQAGHSVDRVMVGKCSNRELPQFFIDKIGCEVVPFSSPAIDYGNKGKKGGIFRSIVTNLAPRKMVQWLGSMRFISKNIKESGADIVINFYDMIFGLTAMLTLMQRPIINIAHQYLISHSAYPLKGELLSQRATLALMNNFCALRSRKVLALSLYPLTPDERGRMEVVPPLLRSEIFECEAKSEDFILGYMLNPAYYDEVVEWKRNNPDVEVHLFWDKKDEPEVKEHVKGLWMHRLNDKLFLDMMARCKGYITTAGFESVCEAAYLGKPIVMIPAHIEQQINAADAQKAGVGIASNKFDLQTLLDYIPLHNHDNATFKEWVDSAKERYIKALTKF